MRRPILTTRSWQLPSRLRQDRFRELLISAEYNAFDDNLMVAIEKRRDLIEGRQIKLIAIQAPLFLLLAFSLLNIDLNVSVAGFSAATSKALREVVLVISSVFGLGIAAFGRQIVYLNEMLKAEIERKSKGNAFALGFLELRYGVSQDLTHKPFDEQLEGRIHSEVCVWRFGLFSRNRSCNADAYRIWRSNSFVNSDLQTAKLLVGGLVFCNFVCATDQYVRIASLVLVSKHSAV